MNQALLTFTLHESWDYLHDRLAGMSDQEFFWEPVPNCWRIYQAKTGRWTYDYQIPHPHPSPLTTIGWRLVHIAACKIMYYEYAFGPGKLSFPELVIPHTAAEAVRWLEQGHRMLASALAQSSDTTLAQPALTNWGEWVPTWRIFWMLISHDMQHGAEIGCLRHLYRLQHAKAAEQGAVGDAGTPGKVESAWTCYESRHESCCLALAAHLSLDVGLPLS